MDYVKDTWYANTGNGYADCAIYNVKALAAGAAAAYLILRVERAKYAIYPLAWGSALLMEAEKRTGDRRVMNYVGKTGCQSFVVGLATVTNVLLLGKGLKTFFTARNLFKSYAGMRSIFAGGLAAWAAGKQWREDGNNKLTQKRSERWC